MYIHGGAFRILSKDTHWIMALAFARAGYVVFNVNYRLAPRSPYPGALEDVGEAYAWVLENASRFGGDPSRVIVAGESAGGNLALALTLACCQQREEPWAARLYNLRRPPDLVIPACGLLQASAPHRYDAQPIAPMMRDLIHNASRCYLGGASGLSAREGDGVEYPRQFLVKKATTQLFGFVVGARKEYRRSIQVAAGMRCRGPRTQRYDGHAAARKASARQTAARRASV